MSRGYTEQVLRLRATEGDPDPYSGESSQDWSDPDRKWIARSEFEPGDGSETVQARRDQVTDTGILTSLGYPDIRDKDRIQRLGVTWNVTGKPQRWLRPRPHTVTTLTLKEG